MDPIIELKEKKISSLFWKYTIPTVAGSLIFAVYLTIDSIFISHGPGLGDHALGGLGILFSVMNFLSSLGVLVGVGTSSRISIFLGQGDRDTALQVVGTSLLFTFLITIVSIIIVYAFMEPILYWLGATSETYHYAYDFLCFYLPASLFLNLGTTLTNVMKATGYPKKSMFIMGLSVVFNLIFAPLFIFVFEWGMKGAGGATLLSTLASACVLIPHFLSKKSSFRITPSLLRLRPKILYGILNIGFAPFLITSMTSVIVFFTNKQLIYYGGAVAMEGYVVATRIHYIFLMIFTGISQGIQPIIGYNFGAKNYKRMFSTLNYAFRVAFATGVVIMLIGIFAGKYLVLVFNPSPELAEIASKAVIVLTITFPLAGCQILMSGFFQHTGFALKSAMLSLVRQLFFFIPLIYMLPLFWGVDGVWASLPFSETLAALLTYLIFFLHKRRYTNPELSV